MSVEIATPCIKVCMLDPEAGLCLGCGRTGSEIAGWLAMSPDTRALVMAKLPERLAAALEELRAKAAAR